MKETAYLMQHLGCGFYCLKSVNSTNSYARNMFLGSEVAVIADSQTGGRGRQDRSFYSPEGGIYFSWALPQEKVQHPEYLTVKAAVCTLEALEELTGKEYRIKWVNDIFLEDKKVCGILCEYFPGNPYGSGDGFYVCGFGINTGAEGFPKELQDIAGGVGPVDRPELICRIVNAMRREVAPEELIALYGRKSYLTGKDVCYVLNGEEKTGRVLGVNEAGNLRVFSGGKEELLNSGEVRVKAL